MDFGLLHGLPQRQLARRQWPLLRSLGFVLGVGDVGIIFDDGGGLQVGQVA